MENRLNKGCHTAESLTSEFDKLYVSRYFIFRCIDLDTDLATMMSDQGFLYFVLNQSRVCQIKKNRQKTC